MSPVDFPLYSTALSACSNTFGRFGNPFAASALERCPRRKTTMSPSPRRNGGGFRVLQKWRDRFSYCQYGLCGCDGFQLVTICNQLTSHSFQPVIICYRLTAVPSTGFQLVTPCHRLADSKFRRLQKWRDCFSWLNLPVCSRIARNRTVIDGNDGFKEMHIYEPSLICPYDQNDKNNQNHCYCSLSDLRPIVKKPVPAMPLIHTFLCLV